MPKKSKESRISARIDEIYGIQKWNSEDIRLIKEYLKIKTTYQSDRVVVKQPSAFRRWWNRFTRKGY
jgi:hypothetical protein